MSDLLLSGTGTGSSSGATGYIYYTRLQALLSGALNKFSILADSTATNARVALYSDSSSTPASLLCETESTALTISAWNDIVIPSPVDIVSGTYYWIALQISVTGGFKAFSRSGDRAQSQTYGAFPATASSFANAYGFNGKGYRHFSAPACYLHARRDRLNMKGVSTQNSLA